MLCSWWKYWRHIVGFVTWITHVLTVWWLGSTLSSMLVVNMSVPSPLPYHWRHIAAPLIQHHYWMCAHYKCMYDIIIIALPPWGQIHIGCQCQSYLSSVSLSSIRCTSRAHISKTKQERSMQWTLFRSWLYWFYCHIQIVLQIPFRLLRLPCSQESTVTGRRWPNFVFVYGNLLFVGSLFFGRKRYTYFRYFYFFWSEQLCFWP